MLLFLLAPLAFGAPSAELLAARTLGDCATMQRLEEADPSPPGHLALSRCEAPSAAMAHLEQIPADHPLRPYACWELAKLQLRQGVPQAALTSLEGQSLPGAPGLQLRLTRARALLALHRSLEARDDLRRLLDTSVGDEARFLLAEGALQRGDREAATVTYQRVWRDAVRGPWADLSAERLAMLGHPIDDPKDLSNAALVEGRIASLDKAYAYPASFELWTGLYPDAAHQASTAWEYGRRASKAKQYPEALEAWSTVLGAPEVASGPPGRMFDYALTTSRTGDYANAAIIYARLIDQHPASEEADEASFKLGFLRWDSQDWPGAERAFREHLTRYPSGAHAASARWFLARALWHQGRTDDAVAQLSHLLDHKVLGPGAAYWTARASGLAGDAAEEERQLRALLDRHPTSGHAWFASSRLGHQIPPQPQATAPALPEAWASRTSVVTARALLEAGQPTWAGEVLATDLSLFESGADDDKLAMAWLFLETGQVRTARKLVKGRCRSPRSGHDPVVQQVCYPRFYPGLIATAAQGSALPLLLPYAIMTVESAMDPGATSLAGARGLMQLMPEVAADIHEQVLPGSPFDPDRLYEPSYNTFLAVHTLATSHEALKGKLQPDQLPAVIAAYNGGDDAVQRWLDRHPDGMDTFAEDISYTETRRYVRSVLGHLMAWRWVHGDR